MNKVITLGVTFILGVGAGWILQGKHWNVLLTSYVPALATLVAAFYGAKYAFQFQNDKEIKDNTRGNIVNGNIAIFSMKRMLIKLMDFQKQVIDPARDLQVNFLQMQPTIQINNDIKFNIESLYFLLDTDDKNLLGELVREEERYLITLDAINERSRFHREEIQPALDKAGIVLGCSYPYSPSDIGNIERALGNRRYITIKQATTDVIELVDKTVISLKDVSEKLTTCLKKYYKNEINSFEVTK
jgi:hypothetical protein